MPFLAAVGLGLALRFLVPIPVGITVQAWTLLSIFASTIAGGWADRLRSAARRAAHHCLALRAVAGMPCRPLLPLPSTRIATPAA